MASITHVKTIAGVARKHFVLTLAANGRIMSSTLDESRAAQFTEKDFRLCETFYQNKPPEEQRDVFFE